MGESAIEVVLDCPPIAALPYWQQMGALGVPPHVTLLYPWRPSPIDEDSVAALRVVAERFTPFTMMLEGVETFPTGVVYATVEPDLVLRSMIRALTETFPDTPPFGGEFAASGPTPHCTLAKCDPSQLDTLRNEFRERLRPSLPAILNVASICVEAESDSGMWSITSVVELGAAGHTP
jgi:hypothetical protein